MNKMNKMIQILLCFIICIVSILNGFILLPSSRHIQSTSILPQSSVTIPSPPINRDYDGRGINSFVDREKKVYSKVIGGSKAYSRGGGRDSRDSFGRSGGGGRSFNRRPESDNLLKLKFSKTIKINPDIQSPIEDMNMSDVTKKILQKKGFTVMTPVQSQSYDFVYSGQDVVARSRTGTGKTLAFGLPIIEKLVTDKKHLKRASELPIVIILEPTRELALQVAQELGQVASAHGLRVTAMFGGSSMFGQERELRNGVHILVCTPGRCLDHISRGNLDLSYVEHVVLDEGDTMLEMGFQNDVESIIANVKTPGLEARNAASKALETRDDWDSFGEPDEDDDDFKETLIDFADKSKARDVQMLLYSATMPGWICKLTTKHMDDPVFLDAVQEGETRLASTIKHYAIRLPRSEDRVRTISSSVEDLILTHGAGGQTIVFTNTKDDADSIVAADCFGQLRAQVLHGDISQGSRQTTIKQFKEGAIDVLVATDVAARGLDIAGVDLVVHAGPPNDHDTYVYRSGRTGRAGRNGTSVMLYTYSGEMSKLDNFERTLNFRFEKTSVPSASDVAKASAFYAAKKLQKIDESAIDYFLPHAKSLVKAMLEEDEFQLPSIEDLPNDIDSEYSSEKVSKLMARCLAALSNKQTINSRSLLTGERDKVTLQINAVFKNGTSPSSVRDWQRVFLGLVRRAMNMEDVSIGRVAMGRLKNRQFCGLVDVSTKDANDILKLIEDDTNILPKGIEIIRCDQVPDIIEDNSVRESSYGSRDSGRPSYGRDRDRDSSSGRRSYSGFKSGGGGEFSRDRYSQDRRSFSR